MQSLFSILKVIVFWVSNGDVSPLLNKRICFRFHRNYIFNANNIGNSALSQWYRGKLQLKLTAFVVDDFCAKKWNDIGL